MSRQTFDLDHIRRSLIKASPSFVHRLAGQDTPGSGAHGTSRLG